MTFWELVAAVALGVALGYGMAVGAVTIIAVSARLAHRFLDGVQLAKDRARRERAQAAEREHIANLPPRKPHECGIACAGVCPEWWKS